MTPQFVDLNDDGHLDMVAATFEGTAFLVEGTEEGWEEPKHIVDENDSNVRIDFYYDLDENEYRNVDRSSDDYESVDGHHMTSIALVDWDNDGDQDLILGAYEGGLYLCTNKGTAKEPKFSKTNDRLMADGKHAMIEDGLATPRVVDWDGDGLFDILCGGAKGGVFMFRNTGAMGKPEFAAVATLIEKSTGKVDLDDNEEGDAEMSSFLHSMMVPAKDGQPTCPGTSFHIEAVDYDQDGDLDLLIGAQSYYQKEKKVLTADEKKDLPELKKRMQAIESVMEKLYADKEQEEMEELYESDEFKALSEKMSELYPKIEALQPSIEAANYIWLYRNKSNTTETSSETGSTADVSETAAHQFDPNEFAVHASFSPERVAGGDEVTLRVQIHVPKGYHIYGSNSGVEPTTLTIDETGSLDTGETVEIPKGRMVVDSGKPAWWLDGVITLEQKMTVPADFTSTTVEGTIGYMICNEQGCRPPTTEKFTATLQGATK